jgi:hypothetical protein
MSSLRAIATLIGGVMLVAGQLRADCYLAFDDRKVDEEEGTCEYREPYVFYDESCPITHERNGAYVFTATRYVKYWWRFWSYEPAQITDWPCEEDPPPPEEMDKVDPEEAHCGEYTEIGPVPGDCVTDGWV